MKFALLATAVSASNLFETKDWASIYRGYINQGFQQEEAMPTGASTWTQCADSAGKFHFTKAVVTPSNVQKGQTTVFDIQGTLDSPITVDNVQVNVKWNGINVKSNTLPGGHFTTVFDLKIDQTIEASAPSGNYVVTATANGSVGGENGTVGCVQGKFSL